MPALRAEPPRGNDGRTSPGSAREVLEELRRFRRARLGSETVLVEDGTGGVVATYAGAGGGVFVRDGVCGFEVGVDPGGLFVRG